MVHLEKIMQHLEEEILSTNNTSKWLFLYIFKKPIELIKCEPINQLSLNGFMGNAIDENILDACVNNSSKLNYSSSVSRFIGIHLGDHNKKYKNKVISFYKNLKENKQKYVFALCFPYLQDEFKSDILKMGEDKVIYQYLFNQEITSINIPSYNINNLDVFDLIIYKKLLQKDFNSLIKNNNMPETIVHMLNNFSNAIIKITTSRYNKKTGFIISQEYDVQDILFAFFKFYFNDAVRENPLKKRGGSNSIIDICFPERKIYIEVKMLKENDTDERKVIDQLKKDIFDYDQKEVENLIIFIYDPYKKIKDKDNFKEFEKDKNHNYKCFVIIQS